MSSSVSAGEILLSTETTKPEHEIQEDREASIFEKKSAFGWVLLVAAICLLTSGSYDTIASKLMNKQKLAPCNDCRPRYFEAPFFQTFTMYIGESICLIAYFFDKWISSQHSKGKMLDFPTSDNSFTKPPCPKWLWSIPTVLDFIASTMVGYAIVLTQASTVLLLRNFSVIATAFLSILYIKIALRRHQFVGVFIVTIGLGVTGIFAYTHPEGDNNHSGMDWLGILLAMIGTLLNAIQSIIEERLFRKYKASPLEAVGLMGIFGLILGGIALAILQYMNIEKTSETIYMMSQRTKESTIIIIANVTFVISVCIFNASGLIVTKFSSAVLRVVLMSARTASIWIIELLLKWNTFDWLNCGGLITVIAGVLVYNYNFIIPPNSWKGDLIIRKAVVFCGAKDPDKVEESIARETGKPNSTDLEKCDGENQNKGRRPEEQIRQNFSQVTSPGKLSDDNTIDLGLYVTFSDNKQNVENGG